MHLPLKIRWLTMITAGLGLALMTVAATRGPIVSLLVILFTLGANAAIRVIRDSAKSIVTLLVLSAVFFMFPMQLLQYVEQHYGFTVLSGLELMGTEYDQSAESRRTSFAGAWEQFLENPIVGDSLEEKLTGFYPHNNILEAFMATGILGGSMMVLLYLFSIATAIKLIASKSTYSWIGVILLQYIVGTQFSGAIWSSDALFCLMALASVSVAGLRQRAVVSIRHFHGKRQPFSTLKTP
jgi:O-antigen ligase